MFGRRDVRKPSYLFWDTVRQREEVLHGRARAVPGDPGHTSTSLLYWDVGVDTGVAGLDTVAYSGRRIERRIAPEHLAMLAIFSNYDLQTGRRGKMLLYYMNLRRDREELLAFSTTENVTKQMLTVPGVLGQHVTNSPDYNSHKAVGPTPDDEHVVLAELVRGQSEVFARDY